jgi:YafQ family addiction module toxin component
MYNYEIKPSLQKILNKLSKKDSKLCDQVFNKIEEVINSESIEHYKNLRYDLSDFKRVHIGHFVLIFKLDKNLNLISFEDFEHHDSAYKK